MAGGAPAPTAGSSAQLAVNWIPLPWSGRLRVLYSRIVGSRWTGHGNAGAARLLIRARNRERGRTRRENPRVLVDGRVHGGSPRIRRSTRRGEPASPRRLRSLIDDFPTGTPDESFESRHLML